MATVLIKLYFFLNGIQLLLILFNKKSPDKYYRDLVLNICMLQLHIRSLVLFAKKEIEPAIICNLKCFHNNYDAKLNK